MRLLMIVVIFCLNSISLNAADISTSAGKVSINLVLGGLDQPWGLAFLPAGGFLVTERGGRLVHASADGKVNTVTGIPRSVAIGQGGLLDVMVPRDFAESRLVFLSYAKKQGRSAGTALVVATMADDYSRLENRRVIFEMTPGSTGDTHFGGRIVESRDGTIFLTLGERGDRRSAQDLGRHNGSIIRINRDGTVPPDNPFASQANARSEIWSYGHRNPQGAALDAQGRLWVTEHGARGGDEVNLIKDRANYGWPVISYGTHYSGRKIGEGSRKPGMQQPAHYWDPSIAPSGLMIYSGKLWPQWRGDFFVGSLKFGYVSRLDPDRGWAEEQLKSGDTRRVRDVREAPDGTIWFLSARKGAVFRMSPG